MKKLLVAVLTAATFIATAQEAPKVTSAIIALRGNEIVEAKQFIDEATTIIDGKNQADIKEKIMSKFYYNKALIYSRIAASPDAEIKALAPEAKDVAAQSLLDLLQFETTAKKQLYTEDAQRESLNIAFNYLVEAGAAYEAGNYNAAYDGYMAAFEFKQNELLGKVASVDTNLLFNAGIIAGSAGDLEKSSAAFAQCIEMGYKGITYSATDVMGEPKQYPNKEAMEKEITAGLASDPVVGEDVRPSVYISLINNAKKMDKVDSYNKWLTEAREAYPENKDLLDIQLQAYLDVKDYEGAMNNLNEAIAKNPEKGIYHFVKGNIMQTEMKDLDGALAEYKAALEVEPDMSDALYMCGLVYIDRANNITEEMNSLSLSQTTKYNKLKADQKSIFQESLQYFESAYEMKSDDMDIVQALMEVYRKVGNYEKSMEMKAILDEAEE
jgi:hypothetical protein